jgi:hypothetical protein
MQKLFTSVNQKALVLDVEIFFSGRILSLRNQVCKFVNNQGCKFEQYLSDKVLFNTGFSRVFWRLIYRIGPETRPCMTEVACNQGM